MSQAAATPGRRALTFVAGGRTLALPADEVGEVTAKPPIARVPLAPPGLLGLANIRGRVAPILELGALLGGAGDPEAAQIVLIEGEHPVGLAVTRVLGVAEPSGEVETLDVAQLLARAAAGIPARRASDAAFVDAAADAQASTASFLTFGVGGQTYGLSLTDVREVARAPDRIAVLPHTDMAMLGAAEIRGGLVPVVSLRILLGFAHEPPTAASRLVVVSVGGAPVALLVDAVRAVVRASEHDVAPAPSLLNRAAGEARIETLVRRTDGLVAVLSPDALFDEPTTAALAIVGGEAAEETSAASDEESASFLRFWLGGEAYGFPANAIEALAPTPPQISRAPKAPAFIVGLMNHRGAVVPLIDQRRRFGASGARPHRSQVIVTRVEGLVAGLVVDRADRVLVLPKAGLVPAADLLAGDARVFGHAVIDGPDSQPFLIVEPRTLLDQAERDIVREWASHAKSAA